MYFEKGHTRMRVNRRGKDERMNGCENALNCKGFKDFCGGKKMKKVRKKTQKNREKGLQFFRV